MMIPPKLKAGDGVRIIAPSCTLASLAWMTDAYLDRAKQFFLDRGMTVSEGEYVREKDDFDSTSIEHRISDLHDAFLDPSVQLIATIRGGWNCNQLLRYLDYDLIRKHPKILCGFSDITALGNAIFAKTGLVTYSGPNLCHFSFGPQLQYSFDSYKRCLMQEIPFDIHPSKEWTDDRFTSEHELLVFEPNEGYWTLQEGEARGTLIGGNLCTLILLQGTEYMPSLKESILFLEDDYETHPRTFDRQLQSIIHQPDFGGVKGIVFGRFQKYAANKDMQPMDRILLTQIVASKQELKKMPIIANVDFGHTHPIITFPIGGKVRMIATHEKSTITIEEH